MRGRRARGVSELGGPLALSTVSTNPSSINLSPVMSSAGSQTTFGIWIINKAGGLIYQRNYAGQSAQRAHAVRIPHQAESYD